MNIENIGRIEAETMLTRGNNVQRGQHRIQLELPEHVSLEDALKMRDGFVRQLCSTGVLEISSELFAFPEKPSESPWPEVDLD